MASKDLASRVKHVQSLAPAARTASADGTGVDTLNYDGVMVVVNAGLWTDGTHTIDIQESDDGTSYSSVAAGNLQGTKPVIDGATDDNQDYEVGYIGNCRYVRVDVDVTASPTTGAVIGASIMLGHAKQLPA